MPEGLFHKGEIDVACYKMRRQRMLQHMWVPLGWLKPGCLGGRLEHPEKLGAVKASALLRREQIARAVCGAFAEPRLDYSNLVQQGLTTVPVERLHGLERPFNLEQPMPEDADTTTRKQMICKALPELRKKVRRLCSDGDMPVILIGSPTTAIRDLPRWYLTRHWNAGLGSVIFL